MILTKVNISKIAIHQIYQRDSMAEIVKPTKGEELINFDPAASSTFKIRVTEALGNDSKAVEMSIKNDQDDSIVVKVDSLISATDAEFIETSYDIACKLAKAQNRRSYTGGIVVVFKGLYGSHDLPFIGIMKADIYSAYEKKQDPHTKQITLNYVREALLTPATKLYKTAGFFQKKDTSSETKSKDKYTVLVSDTQISQVDGKAAAQYFYSAFLGCGYPESSAKTTSDYYEFTRKFIDELPVEQDRKNQLLNSLNSYLYFEKSSLVEPKEFSNRYLEPEERKQYKDEIEEKGIPFSAFTRDTKFIESKLKTRKIEFKKQIKIIAPAKDFGELVTFEEFDEPTGDGNTEKWTRVLIKDRITAQE
jgi:hypothetical protein